MTNTHQLLFITSSPCYFEDLAQALLELDVTEAMNLDGGSSSAMAANGQLITAPLTSGASTMLAVYTRKTPWWTRAYAMVWADELR